jgi:hypothetical protein
VAAAAAAVAPLVFQLFLLLSVRAWGSGCMEPMDFKQRKPVAATDWRLDSRALHISYRFCSIIRDCCCYLFLSFLSFLVFLPTHLSVGDVRMQPFSYLPFCQAHRKRLRFRLNHHFTPCNFKAEKNWSCQKDFDVSVGRQMVSGFMKTASCRRGSSHTYELIQYEWFQQ